MCALSAMGIALSVVVVIVGTLFLCVSILEEHPEGNRMAYIPDYIIRLQFLGIIAHIGLIFLFIGMMNAARESSREAWETGAVLARIGTFVVPVGTLIFIRVLVEWTRPETKRWFGFDV